MEAGCEVGCHGRGAVMVFNAGVAVLVVEKGVAPRTGSPNFGHVVTRLSAACCLRIIVLSDDNARMSSSSACRPVVYDDAVTSADLDEWDHEFDALMARVRPLFYRTESKKHAEQYIRGLLSPLARKNGWTIAEYVGEPEPTALQRLLNLSPWDVDALLALNREYAMASFADPGGLLVADPTGFAKKGRKSVGVQRQYSGTLGRIDNCQIATFLAYVTPRRDRVLIHGRSKIVDHGVRPRSWKGRCILRPAQRVASLMSRRPARCSVPMARLRRPAMTRGPERVRARESSSR